MEQEKDTLDPAITEIETIEEAIATETTEEELKTEQLGTEKPVEEKPAWDKERQRADQAEANFRKLQAEKQKLESNLEIQKTQAEQLQTKLDEFAKVNEVDLDQIDADLTDPVLLKALKSMKSKVDAANNRVADLEKVAKGYEELERGKQLTASQEAAKSEIIADIESEYPAKFRNEALKAANEICEKRGFAPTDRYEAAKLLRDCYKKLASGKPATTTAKPAPSDNGKTTVTANKETEIKPGTHSEVMAQIRAKYKT